MVVGMQWAIEFFRIESVFSELVLLQCLPHFAYFYTNNIKAEWSEHVDAARRTDLWNGDRLIAPRIDMLYAFFLMMQ